MPSSHSPPFWQGLGLHLSEKLDWHESRRNDIKSYACLIQIINSEAMKKKIITFCICTCIPGPSCGAFTPNPSFIWLIIVAFCSIQTRIQGSNTSIGNYIKTYDLPYQLIYLFVYHKLDISSAKPRTMLYLHDKHGVDNHRRLWS